MNIFYTNLFATSGKHLPFKEIKGKKFIFKLLKEKGIRFAQEYYRLLIITSTKERAQYIVDLLRASQTLFEGVYIDPDEFHISVFDNLKPEEEYNQRIDRENPQVDNTFELDEFGDIINPYIGMMITAVPQICYIAAKASFSLQYQYALFKYQNSLNFISLDIFFFDPTEWEPFKSVSKYPKVHVDYASAIIFAYSVLEELGLEVRASKKTPSILANGEKNPKVADDLLKRLVKRKIATQEPLVWTQRNKKTKIQSQKKPIKYIKKTEWTWGQIRDGYVDFVDAIFYASFLRSRISSHRFNSLTPSLSLYDVLNIQYLAYRLLHETLGTWKINILEKL